MLNNKFGPVKQKFCHWGAPKNAHGTLISWSTDEKQLLVLRLYGRRCVGSKRHGKLCLGWLD